MKQRLKCGIVGYGYMGEIRKRVIENNPLLELYGICDNGSGSIADDINCQFFRDYEDIVKSNVDIVFVCTPNAYSSEVCLESLKQGKHVFCEKPPGRNIEELQMIGTWNQGHAKLMFGFNHRFHPGVIKAKRITESGRLGNIVNLRGVYGKSGGKEFSKSWRNDRNVSGGGILLDQGIHMLDLFLLFCGDFERVKCFVGNSYWNFKVEDNAYVILQNNKGQSAMLHSSATMWKHTFRLDITLENGYMTIEGLLSKSGSYGRERIILGKRQFEDESEAVGNPSEEITYFDRDQSWDMEINEFTNCIINDKPVTYCSFADAVKVMEIVEKAYHDSKRTVT